MYFKTFTLAFKKYKWFFMSFISELILLSFNFINYFEYKKLLFNLDFKYLDFLYHNLLLPFNLSIIVSIIFYILIIFESEYKKNLISLEFLKEMECFYLEFKKNFNEETLTKEKLFELNLSDGQETFYYSQNFSFYRKQRNLSVLLDHCGKMYRTINDLLNLGVLDSELLKTLSEIKHSQFMRNYEMIYKNAWDEREIAPFEMNEDIIIRNGKKGLQVDMQDHIKNYNEYMLKLKNLEGHIKRLSYFK